MIGKTISHYRILKELGRGGMGVVYKALDTNLNRTVALKFLSPDLTRDSEAVTRFIHEAQTASALDHANICTIHEISETDEGQKFICMTYYHGETLQEKIKRGPLPVEEAIDIALQVAQGLQRVHEAGITHRDIKPTNLIITDRCEVKIVDFGLAKLAKQDRLTKSGTTPGTVAYMSPEQAQGKTVDHRTDIWSLGVVLYEMLMGKLPFRGEYEIALVYSIVNEAPETMSGLRTDVPMELERMISKALTKNPDDRYPNANQLLTDLKSLKVGGVPNAVKEWEMKARLARRKRAYLYAVFASVFVLLFSIGLYFFTGHDNAIDTAAVLPFVNVNGDPNNEYLSDGITESLINSLSQLPNLKVIARSSVFRYKGQEIDPQKIAQNLGVRGICTGRVFQRGDTLLISVELVDAPDNRQLWGGRYTRKLADVFAVQEEIAREISGKLRQKLTGEEERRLTKRYTENTEAYQLYLKGRYFWNKRTEEGFKKAIECFRQAIEKDPAFALAYAGLADCYLAGPYFQLHPKEYVSKGKAAAMEALEIDDTLAEAHTSLAMLKWSEWDFWEAEKEFKRAIELNPNYATAHHWYAGYLSGLGRHNEAIDEINRAQELDPLSLPISREVGDIFLLARQHDRAIEQYRKTLEMDPNFVMAHLSLGWAYEQKGMYDEAIAEFRKFITLARDTTHIAWIGHADAMSGNRVEAIKIIGELNELSKRQYVPPFYFAIIYTALGEKDQAFTWLEKAYEAHQMRLASLKVDPTLDSLRSDPRFTALLKQVGLEK